MGEVGVRRAPVRLNAQVAPDLFLLKVKGRFPAGPGRFYMLRAWDLDPPLSRPLSVLDRTDEEISFLYAVRGRGTELLSRLSPGDPLTLFGPLGNGWARAGERVALIGGGVGIAPLLYTARLFGKVDVYLGFRGRPFLVDEFEAVAGRLYLSSESGEGARQGLITDLFRPDGYDACYACGPFPMLAAVSEACQRAGVPLFVSLEERMACGIGACLGCAVKTRQGFLRVCRDGPVFRAEEVIWDA